MNNVVELKRKREFNIPDDLLTFEEIKEIYGYKYGYVYKWCVLENEIPCYIKQGRRAIRESDWVKFLEKRMQKWRA